MIRDVTFGMKIKVRSCMEVSGSYGLVYYLGV